MKSDPPATVTTVIQFSEQKINNMLRLLDKVAQEEESFDVRKIKLVENVRKWERSAEQTLQAFVAFESLRKPGTISRTKMSTPISVTAMETVQHTTAPESLTTNVHFSEASSKKTSPLPTRGSQASQAQVAEKENYSANHCEQ